MCISDFHTLYCTFYGELCPGVFGAICTKQAFWSYGWVAEGHPKLSRKSICFLLNILRVNWKEVATRKNVNKMCWFYPSPAPWMWSSNNSCKESRGLKEDFHSFYHRKCSCFSIWHVLEFSQDSGVSPWPHATLMGCKMGLCRQWDGYVVVFRSGP